MGAQASDEEGKEEISFSQISLLLFSFFNPIQSFAEFSLEFEKYLGIMFPFTSKMAEEIT